jgi:hypothetical protein
MPGSAGGEGRHRQASPRDPCTPGIWNALIVVVEPIAMSHDNPTDPTRKPAPKRP